MSFVRWVFLLALVMLIAGIGIGQRLLGPMFATRALTAPNVAVVQPTAKPTRAPSATSVPIAHPTVSVPTPTSPAATPTASATTALAPTATHIPARTVGPIAHRRTIHHRTSLSPTVTPLPTASATAVATATSGLVALSRYWIGTPSARAGTLISVGYVINNGTGHTARIMLGASVKSSRTIGWIASIADPAHDVVAIVPPGISTHIRYFTLPSRLHVGSYDVAWGLRNAVNGARDALVFAPEALQVGH